jgi:hypothetical protein
MRMIAFTVILAGTTCRPGGISDSGPVPIQHLTYATYNDSPIIVPGDCLSVTADPGIASIDFQYAWDGNPGNVQEADNWPNGQASCITADQTQYFGTYQLLQAKSSVDDTWAYVSPAAGLLAAWVGLEPPAVPAVPVRWTQVGAPILLLDGSLRFNDSWESSTGDPTLKDLARCQVGELVTLSWYCQKVSVAKPSLGQYRRADRT